MRSVERLDKSSDNEDIKGWRIKKNRISMRFLEEKYHEWNLVTNLTICNVGKVSQR